MAFVLADVGSDSVEIDVLSGEVEYIARVALGADDETDEVYSVVVVLLRQPNLPPDRMELMFGITRGIEGGDAPEWISDGLTTKVFLKGADRQTALDRICTAAIVVAEHALPEAITFVTAVPYLPEKALTKYGHICKALRSVGYFGGRGDSYHGSEIWMLKRRKTET